MTITFDTWYPLLIDTGPSPTFDINNAGTIVPDWARNRIYSYGRVAPFTSVIYKFWEHNATDGTFVSEHLFSDVCVISGNTFVPGESNTVILGTDGFIYATTTHGNTSGPQQANMRLSKINPTTWTEVAAVIPFAISSGSYGVVGAGDWSMAVFKLSGVDYIALALNTQQPAPLEIFNSSLTSLTHYDFTYPNGSDDVFILPADQPTASTQRLYLVEDGPNDPQITFVIATFNNAPSISDTGIIATINAGDIDPTWSAQDTCELLAPMYDPLDKSVVFFVLAEPLEHSKLVKMSSAGAIVWASADVSTTVFSLTQFSIDMAAGLSDLSSGTLIFCNPNTPEYLTVNLSDGSFTRTASTHLDGPIPPNQNGVRQAAVWDGTRIALIYYYEGSNDLRPAWPTKGWAVLRSNSPPPPPPPPLAGSGRRWIARLGPVRTAAVVTPPVTPPSPPSTGTPIGLLLTLTR